MPSGVQHVNLGNMGRDECNNYIHVYMYVHTRRYTRLSRYRERQYLEEQNLQDGRHGVRPGSRSQVKGHCQMSSQGAVLRRYRSGQQYINSHPIRGSQVNQV